MAEEPLPSVPAHPANPPGKRWFRSKSVLEIPLLLVSLLLLWYAVSGRAARSRDSVPMLTLQSAALKRGDLLAVSFSHDAYLILLERIKVVVPRELAVHDYDRTFEASERSGWVAILMGGAVEGQGDPPKQNESTTGYWEGLRLDSDSGNSNGAGAERAGEQADGMMPAQGRHGASKYSFVDPWGNYFQVRLDLGGDGRVENPDEDQVAKGRSFLHQRVIVWSPGEDGKEETWGDNPRSWE